MGDNQYPDCGEKFLSAALVCVIFFNHDEFIRFFLPFIQRDDGMDFKQTAPQKKLVPKYRLKKYSWYRIHIRRYFTNSENMTIYL